MKGVLAAPGDYVHFKSQVPLHKIPDLSTWMFMCCKLTLVTGLLFLGFGALGTADVYYKQIMALSMKGYRVISVDIPRVWNHMEWIQAFEKFLDVIDVRHMHLYGTSLGGFLAQIFAQYRPRRVKSLVLSNSFLDTRSFAAAMPWAPFVSWTPSFLLKRYVLTGIQDGPHEPFIADSVDFVVSQVETLSKDDLASRLTLNVDAQAVGSLLLSDQFITIMDVSSPQPVHILLHNRRYGFFQLMLSVSSLKTNDYSATPRQLKDQLTERYPEAKQANLKTGGEFPFLSRPDEVNLHLQLHLRRVGVEPRPDLVKSGIPGGDTSGGGSGSPSKKNDENEDNPDDDYQPKDEGNSEIPSSSSGGNPLPLPPPESSESQTTTDASTYTKEPSKKHVVDSYFVTHLVESYVAYLYISLNYSRSSGQVV
ncbi:SPG21 [Linum perenne]